MKNMETILADSGITLTDEQKSSINKAVAENYKTVADYDKQKDKLTNAEDKVKTLTESLDKFKDVNVEELSETVTDLKEQLKKKDDDYASQIADRDFSEIVKDSIAKANGKNAKAIKALLDIDTLKGSKNQKEDIEKAIKELSEAEDSKMLFGEPDPTVITKTNPIGQVIKSGETLTGVEKAFLDRNPGLKVD